MKFTLQEYKELFLKSKTILKTALFYVKIFSNHQRELIVVTSRKIGNAPERNYLRRITKVIFNDFHLLEKYNFTYIVIFTKPKIKIKYQSLREEIIPLQEILDKKQRLKTIVS